MINKYYNLNFYEKTYSNKNKLFYDLILYHQT